MSANVKRMNGLAIALLMLGLSVLAFAGPASAASFSFSKAGHDSYAYIPGEELTITYSGLTTTRQYDLRIGLANGTQVMDAWNLTPDGAGNIVWTFAIPADWDGYYYARGYYNNSTSTLNVASFQVYLFRLTAQLDHQVYLPGDTMTVYYFTQQLADQKPLASGHGFWKATIRRDNGSGPDIIDPVGNSVSSTSGSFFFQLPAGTKTGAYSVDLTYNDTTDKHSDQYSLTLYVGALQIGVTTDRSTYAPADPVVVRVDLTASYSFITEPSANVVLTTKVYEYDTGNATWIEDSAYTVPSQTSGVSGVVSFVI